MYFMQEAGEPLRLKYQKAGYGPYAENNASRFLLQHPDTLSRFDKVAQLVEGFESPFGLGLLSTVHWVINKESASTREQAIRQVYDWNDRKHQFSERQIDLAARVLETKGWTEAV
ncbi:hypothetical protein [Marinobacter sp. LV10R510-11A]|uniref:hypothetical protein n=1 Tax=Marinobacter sp. LV10R510-11A TaxID=1415568 RepID=UPI001D0CF0B4|nr:hypothetical protein [Marinobacter sp. LV10R510-11A]